MANRCHQGWKAKYKEPVAPDTTSLPPLDEQEAIAEAVEDQLSVIDHVAAGLDAKLTAAQALRQSILRHAFTGRLVPQDPNDEPASELLKRIAAEREERARKEGRPSRTRQRRDNQRRDNERRGKQESPLGQE